MKSAINNIWIEEIYHDVSALRFPIERVLFSEKGPFQQVDIVETKAFGRMLLNDGCVMTSEKDEYIYHEMISHVPLFCHPDPRNVLIIGGGDGGTLREVLRHPQVEKCTMVEIDELVVRACKEHLQATACQLEHPKAEVRIEDGVEFVAKCSQTFDVILVDSSDPVGPAAPLFGSEFYKNVQSCLAPDGIVVSQAESSFFEAETQKSILGILKERFRQVHLYNYVNATYPGFYWSFSFASNNICPIADFNLERAQNIQWPLKYYNADIHRASFCLPNFMRENLGSYLTPFKKDTWK